MADIDFGDVIYIERHEIINYKHFGIYSGNERVIHYTKDTSGDSCDGIIRETSLKKFLNGDRNLYICDFDNLGKRIRERKVDLPIAEGIIEVPVSFGYALIIRIFEKIFGEAEGKLYSPQETVQRARDHIGTRQYDFFLNNCEHFAVWCKTGLSKSEQIDEFLDIILDGSMHSIKTVRI